MPVQQLPDEFIKSIGSPSNSSLSSASSDVILISPNYARNSRSASVSSSSTNINDDDSIDSSVNANNARNRNLHSNEGIEEEETYQPIKLPSEPTLEELLRQVTGKHDISMIEQVKLRIISSAISLQRLPYFMPRLRCLNLEGSMLFSLRDLGCDLSSLTYLNISRCGLKSLDGTNGLSTLTELVADHNLIEDAGPCSNIPHIQKISLVSNKIKDYSGMMFLGLCPQLRVLDLTNNAITQKENYSVVVKGHIPQLAILDVVAFEEVSDDVKIELSRSEYQSTLNNSANIIRRLDSIQNNLQGVRPSSAAPTTPPITHISIGRRPTTADKYKPQLKHHNLSVGEPVCGNIIAKVRQPKKQLRHAWGDSASSSSSFSSDSSPRNSAGTRSVADSTETLLENSRVWRQNSRETREKFNDR